VAGAVVALALLGVLVAALDWREARRLVGEAHWAQVAPALLFTALSYASLSLGFAAVNRIFGTRLGSRDLFEIGFVSFALNNLVSMGGAAGYSLRLLLMQRRGIRTGDVLAASIVYSYMNHVVMGLLLPAGLVYLLLVRPLTPAQQAGIAIATALTLAALGLMTVSLFSQRVRDAVRRGVVFAARVIAHRDLSESLAHFDATLERGFSVLRAQPRRLILPVAFVAGDWLGCTIALGFCFEALGAHLTPGVLLTGFVIGVALGLVSMLPGGIGVQEGSMAGVYVLLGVPLEQAALAAILFRVVYYLVPFALSLLLYRRLLRKTAPIADPA
jgi:uncharacterized protein (TIRG00374 family)